METKFGTLITSILFVFWSVRLYYKLYDKHTKKYIMCFSILIILWMLIRFIKVITTNLILERILWYLYYLPLIFAPTLFYICSNIITKNIRKKKIITIFAIATILFLLVLTNDLHQLVFKFPNGIGLFHYYKHNIGYYLICIWIFYSFGGGMINLAFNRLRIKKGFKAFLPLLVLLLGLIYTILYVFDAYEIRQTNMAVINSVLMCIGLELILYLELIPNNAKYKKLFEESDLNMAIISLDTSTKYLSKSFNKIPDFILKDINNNYVKECYEKKNVIYEVKKNKDSYVIFKKDISNIKKLESEIDKKQKYLLEQQEIIKTEININKELEEITLRENVVNKIENTLNEKKEEAKLILKKKNITDNDLEKIRRIILYSKKKSSLMISEINDETYDEKGIKILLDELINSFKALNINGMVVVKNKLNIDGNTMSNLYDIIYNLLEIIPNRTVMIFIYDENNSIIIKNTISGSKKIKDKLKLDLNAKVKEISYDTDLELIIQLLGGDFDD